MKNPTYLVKPNIFLPIKQNDVKSVDTRYCDELNGSTIYVKTYCKIIDFKSFSKIMKIDLLESNDQTGSTPPSER